MSDSGKQYNELASIFSTTCLKCHDELAKQSEGIEYDDIGRKQAIIVLFKFHDKGHQWWPDDEGTSREGMYRINKATAWRHYWNAIDDLESAQKNLQRASGLVYKAGFQRLFIKDKDEINDLPDRWYPENYFRNDVVPRARVRSEVPIWHCMYEEKGYRGSSVHEHPHAKESIPKISQFQTDLQEVMSELSAFRATVIPSGETTDLQTLSQTRQKINELECEIRKFNCEFKKI